MRFVSYLSAAFSIAALFATVSAAADASEPEVVATAAFPETNIFNHVVNGEKNTITLTVENKSARNITLLNIAGSLSLPDTGVVIKNLTSLKYGVPLISSVKVQLPYTFYSEFKPGDHRLNIWLEHSAENVVYKVEAYDSVITVVEPELSIFDLKLLSTYAIVAGLLGSLGYFAFLSFFPQTKKTRKATVPTVSAPVTVTATGAGGYQEEWIPEHHLRKSKSKKTGIASGTSGDELSGGETSGTEGKKRKGKK